mgnify:CR=1 FL=1
MYEVRFNKSGKGKREKRAFKYQSSAIKFASNCEKKGYKVSKIIKLEDKEI